MTRAEKVAKAQELRAQGLKLREIAERMDSNPKTVHTWLSDPDLAQQRARRRGYAGECVDCGGPTDGSNGRAAAPTRCQPCAHEYQHANRLWTRETIIAAIRTFHARYGRVPRANDFNPHHVRTAESERARFYRDGDYPTVGSVQREFGRWRDAIHAAGFESYRPNMPNREESAARREQIVALYASGLGSTTIAERMGLDPVSVMWHLERAGIKRRSPEEAQRLRWERWHEEKAA